jgi:hypothetical protein
VIWRKRFVFDLPQRTPEHLSGFVSPIKGQTVGGNHKAIYPTRSTQKTTILSNTLVELAIGRKRTDRIEVFFYRAQS